MGAWHGRAGLASPPEGAVTPEGWLCTPDRQLPFYL